MYTRLILATRSMNQGPDDLHGIPIDLQAWSPTTWERALPAEEHSTQDVESTGAGMTD
ncbi:hypothetical protein FRC07_001003, partial [Ceratobasidium sp. 392]